MALWKHTSGTELSANPSLKLWAGGMMGHGPAFVFLIKAYCLFPNTPPICCFTQGHHHHHVPLILKWLRRCPLIPEYVVASLVSPIPVWKQHSVCMCTSLCGWGSSTQQMELESGWDGSTPLADIRDLIRGSTCLQASHAHLLLGHKHST